MISITKQSNFVKKIITTQHPANPRQEINPMFKSKTTKEKYNTFLNIIVTQLISGLVGLTLLATPLTDGLCSAQIYALFASLSLIILSYLEFFTLENWRKKKTKKKKNNTASACNKRLPTYHYHEFETKGLTYALHQLISKRTNL